MNRGNKAEGQLQEIVKQDKDMPFNEKITLKLAEKEIAAWIQ